MKSPLSNSNSADHNLDPSISSQLTLLFAQIPPIFFLSAAPISLKSCAFQLGASFKLTLQTSRPPTSNGSTSRRRKPSSDFGAGHIKRTFFQRHGYDLPPPRPPPSPTAPLRTNSTTIQPSQKIPHVLPRTEGLHPSSQAQPTRTQRPRAQPDERTPKPSPPLSQNRQNFSASPCSPIYLSPPEKNPQNLHLFSAKSTASRVRSEPRPRSWSAPKTVTAKSSKKAKTRSSLALPNHLEAARSKSPVFGITLPAVLAAPCSHLSHSSQRSHGSWIHNPIDHRLVELGSDVHPVAILSDVHVPSQTESLYDGYNQGEYEGEEDLDGGYHGHHLGDRNLEGLLQGWDGTELKGSEPGKLEDSASPKMGLMSLDATVENHLVLDAVKLEQAKKSQRRLEAALVSAGMISAPPSNALPHSPSSSSSTSSPLQHPQDMAPELGISVFPSGPYTPGAVLVVSVAIKLPAKFEQEFLPLPTLSAQASTKLVFGLQGRTTFHCDGAFDGDMVNEEHKLLEIWEEDTVVASGTIRYEVTLPKDAVCRTCGTSYEEIPPTFTHITPNSPLHPHSPPEFHLTTHYSLSAHFSGVTARKDLEVTSYPERLYLSNRGWAKDLRLGTGTGIDTVGRFRLVDSNLAYRFTPSNSQTSVLYIHLSLFFALPQPLTTAADIEFLLSSLAPSFTKSSLLEDVLFPASSSVNPNCKMMARTRSFQSDDHLELDVVHAEDEIAQRGLWISAKFRVYVPLREVSVFRSCAGFETKSGIYFSYPLFEEPEVKLKEENDWLDNSESKPASPAASAAGKLTKVWNALLSIFCW
ncbi:hypothetical protein T439DRAFT_32695 [Meredithblackwellia eburnea MCA 4105]